MLSAPRRKQERGHRAQTPFRPFIRSLGVVASTQSEADRLATKIIDVADDQIEGDGPFFSSPVVGGLRVEGECLESFQV